MLDSHVTAQLDQLAATVATQRTQGADNMAGLIQLEQALAGDLTNIFTDQTEHQLGALLLHLGGRTNFIANRLPDNAKPGAMILANVLALAGQALYTANPPATWECPYTLVGGVPCKRLLAAPNDEQLQPRIDGHLALNHPTARRERRA